MLDATELTRLLEPFDNSLEGGYYTVTLDDGDALIAVDGVLNTYAQRASGLDSYYEALNALAKRMDHLLVVAPEEEDPALTFHPFATPGDITTFLGRPCSAASLRVSRDLATARNYAEAMTAVWGQGVSSVANCLERAGNGCLEREIMAVAGVCAVPVSIVAFTLDRERAYCFLSAVFSATESIATVLAAAPPTRLEMAELRADLLRLLRKKQAQIRGTAAALPAVNASGRLSAEHVAVLEHVGALLALRVECRELGQDLAALSIPKHTLNSGASKMGITDPIFIDQNLVLDNLRRLQLLVDDWITTALSTAGSTPADESLPHQVDRIATTTGALRARLTILQVTERTIDAGEVKLYKDLEPQATTLDTALLFLELDKDFENVRSSVITASDNASILLTSYRWSRMVLQAMLDATDLILSIETGGRMCGIGSSLRATTMVRSPISAVRAMGTATALDRLLSGARIVAMASKSNIVKNRKGGIKAEKGEGLSPNRPRKDVGSITGTATARYPDLVKITSFWELKNVLNLRLTRQMVDFILFSQASGLKMVLYVRPKTAGKLATKIAPSLQEALNILRKEGLLEIRTLKIW